MTEDAPGLLRQAAPKATQGWRWIVAASLSVLVFGALFSLFVDPAELLSLLAQVRPLPLIGAASLFVLVNVCRWWRLMVLVPPNQRHPIALLGVSAGHAFFNNILPMRSGELLFPVLLRRAAGLPLASGAVFLATIRLIELAMLVLLYTLAVFGWLATSPHIPEGLDQLRYPLLIASVLALLAIIALPLALRRLWGLGKRLTASERLLRFGLFRKLHDALERSEGDLDRLGHTGIIQLCGATAAMWLGLFGVYHASMIAFDVPIRFLETTVGSVGAILTNLLPINGLGSFGTLEMGWAAGYAAMGQDELGPVVAAGLAMHLVVTAVSGVMALAALAPTPELQN